jgi:hypothetical protein
MINENDKVNPEKDGAAPDKVAALTKIRDEFTGTGGRRQCDRLLAALARFPITTFEAMRHLDVYHCPARVLQLRKLGHEIVTHRKTIVTEAGVRHTVGLYVLRRGGGHA